jgi:hypothetical protein
MNFNWFLLFCCAFFIHSTNLPARVGPLNAPVKPYIEKTAKFNKAEKKSKKKIKPSKVKEFDEFLPYMIFIPLLGLLLVGIGAPLSIVWLWILGLTLLILAGIFISIGLFSFIDTNFDSPPRLKKLFGALAFALILIITTVTYVVLGLTFLIWGLIAAFPVLWISGLIVLLIVVSCFLILMNS